MFVCERERHAEKARVFCEVMPHKAFSVRLALFWKVEGRRGRGVSRGDETKRQLDPKSKKVKNANANAG